MAVENGDYFLAGKNINAYNTFQLFANMAFWLPIYTIFFLTRSLDYTSILLLYAVDKAVQVALEIPSGILADRWGRKPVLMLSSAMQVIGFLLIAFGNGFLWYLVGMVFHGAALAMISGSDSAFIYDTLLAANRQAEFKKIEGRAYMYSLIGGGMGGLLGGVLATKDLALPFVMTAFASFLAFLVMATAIEPPKKGKRPGLKTMIADVSGVIRKNKAVKAIILFASVLIGLLLVNHKFSQPYLQRAGVNIELFGVIYFIWLAFAALSSRYSEKVEKFLGFKLYFLILPLLTGGSLIYLGIYQDMAGIGLIIIHQFAWGSLRPQMNQIINREAATSMRATLLSVIGFGSSIVYIIAAPVAGYFADKNDFPVAFLGLGAAILVVGTIAAIFVIRHCRPVRVTANSAG